MEPLPIRVEIKHLFEAGDVKSQSLIERLQAWINFQTLAANWFADESQIVDVSIVLLPQNRFLDLELDTEQVWQSIQITDDYVYTANAEANTANIYVGLSNTTLKSLMKHPEKVNEGFQEIIKNATNLVAPEFKLSKI